MDFKAFSEEHFDPIQWIDKTLDSSPDPENKESYASTILYRLQVMIQEVDSSLEETSRQIMKELPKLLSQAESLEENANFVKNQVEDLNSKLHELISHDNESSQLIEKLKELHFEKERLSSRDEIETDDNSVVINVEK